MSFDDINEGDRPSRLELARYSAGDLAYGETARIEAWLAEHPGDLAFLAELEAARHDVAPFDAEALRLRASRPDPSALPDPVEHVPANDNSRWMMIAAGVIAFAAVAAVAVTALMLPPPQERVVEPGTRIKSAADMQVYALGGDEKLHLYEGEALGEGDVLGFQVLSAGWDGVVVLSVDGTGTVSVYYPDDGDAPYPTGPGTELVPLKGTVVLDDAPGPEVFVAVFEQSVTDATATVWGQAQGGPDALLDWADRTTWADAVLVERVAP